jgi:hypothetical protein
MTYLQRLRTQEGTSQLLRISYKTFKEILRNFLQTAYGFVTNFLQTFNEFLASM